MGKAVKCKMIYDTQTTHSKGSFNGSGGGIGLSSGGLGVMGGGVSGSTHSTTMSNLAIMFKPMDNELLYKQSEGDSSNIMVCFMGLVAGAMLIVKKNEIASWIIGGSTELSPYLEKLSTMNLLLGAFFTLLSAMKIMEVMGKDSKALPLYDQKQMDLINKNYENAYYDEEEHTIFLDENHKLAASRENFIKLVLNN